MITRTRKYVAAGATVAATLAGLVVLAAPASAHANAVTGSATCQSDGTYTVTWTIANDFNLTETATVTAHAPPGSSLSSSSVNIDTTPGTGTVVQSGISGDYSGTATLNVHGVWSDGYGNNPGEGLAAGAVQLSGSCTQSVPVPGQPVPSAPTCTADGILFVPGDTGQVHWSASPAGTGPGSYTLTASTQAGYLFTGGAATHTFTETVLATSGSNSEACASHLTVPAPVFTNGDCTTAPSLTGASDGIGYSAATTGTPGFATSVTVTFTAKANYRLDGTTVYHFTYAAKADCRTARTPVNPGVRQATCNHSTGTDSGFSITPASTDGISYTLDGLLVTASAIDGSKLGALPSGWSSLSDTAATYTVNRTDPVCLINVSPLAPAVTQSICPSSGSTPSAPTLIFTDTANVSYIAPRGPYPAPGTVLVTATAATGYEFAQTELPAGWTLVGSDTLSNSAKYSVVFALAPLCANTASPTFTDDACQAARPTRSSFTLPSTTGVEFFIHGIKTPAGTYPAAERSQLTVTAHAKHGYTLSGTTSWTHTFNPRPTCTAVHTIHIANPPAAQPAVAATSVQLATTGIPATDLLLLGGLFLLGGAALCLGLRRRGFRG